MRRRAVVQGVVRACLVATVLALACTGVAGQTQRDSIVVILNIEPPDLDPRCPQRAGQFQFAAASESDWVRRNSDGWDWDQVRAVVRRTLAESESAVPGPARIVVCVTLASESSLAILERMRGIAGSAAPPNHIDLFVAPAVSPGWPRQLPFTIAHEYHHLATAQPAPSGLDVMIREGKAHHFAWTLFPDLLHPSAMALAGDDLDAATVTIADHVMDPAPQFTLDFMFGGDYYGGKVPRWAGYTLGFELVRAYSRRHGGLSPLDLVAVPSERIWAER